VAHSVSILIHNNNMYRYLELLPLFLAMVAGSVMYRANDPVDKEQDPEPYSSCAILEKGYVYVITGYPIVYS
jgi:hypothetical protein